MKQESPHNSGEKVNADKLSPEIRDKAALAMHIELNRGMSAGVTAWNGRGTRDKYLAAVDAVAEVLADELRSSQLHLSSLRSDIITALRVDPVSLDGDTDLVAAVGHAVTGLIAELEHSKQAGKDYSNVLGPVLRERDALRAQLQATAGVMAAAREWAAEFEKLGALGQAQRDTGSDFDEASYALAEAVKEAGPCSE